MFRAEERQPDCSDGVGCQFHERIAAQAGLWDSSWLAEAQSKLPLCLGPERAGTPKGRCQRKGEGEGEVRVTAARVSMLSALNHKIETIPIYLY